MRHGGSAISYAHQRLLIGCRGMAHADHDSGLLTVFCQSKIHVMLRRQRNVFNQPFRSLLIPTELVNGRLCDRLRRLGSLIIHVEIRSFKMNSQNLRALIALFYDRGHISHSLLQDIRHLCYRSWKNGGHSFLRYMFHPVS